eukprot:4896864-Amphidinium_carterae.1
MTEKVDISHFMQIKSVWGSIMTSPFSPNPSTWFASQFDRLFHHFIKRSCLSQLCARVRRSSDYPQQANSVHLASKFAIMPESNSSESDSEVEEAPSKKIKPAAAASANDTIQQ